MLVCVVLHTPHQYLYVATCDESCIAQQIGDCFTVASLPLFVVWAKCCTIQGNLISEIEIQSVLRAINARGAVLFCSLAAQSSWKMCKKKKKRKKTQVCAAVFPPPLFPVKFESHQTHTQNLSALSWKFMQCVYSVSGHNTNNSSGWKLVMFTCGTSRKNTTQKKVSKCLPC